MWVLLNRYYAGYYGSALRDIATADSQFATISGKGSPDDNSRWAFGEFTGAALHFLDKIDRNQFERIREIAVLDYIYERE